MAFSLDFLLIAPLQRLIDEYWIDESSFSQENIFSSMDYGLIPLKQGLSWIKLWWSHVRLLHPVVIEQNAKTMLKKAAQSLHIQQHVSFLWELMKRHGRCITLDFNEISLNPNVTPKQFQWLVYDGFFVLHQ